MALGAKSQHKLVRSDLNMATNMAAIIDLHVYLKGPIMAATVGISLGEQYLT